MINKLKKENINRGYIIIFKSPSKMYISEDEYNLENLIATYSSNNFLSETLVKRIIGLPGEHIQIKEDRKVYINEVELDEKYILEDTSPMTYMYIDIIIPANTVYVMGDNRYNSIDSRSFGCIPIDKIQGHVIE